MIDELLVEDRGAVRIVSINRPAARNAVNGPVADALYATFQEFDADAELSVAILTGTGGTFCAGADLKAIATAHGNKINPGPPDQIVHSIAPMGPTRLVLSKPVIAAVEGYAVAGGLELALWCDLRVAANNASFGVFCRRWGVPLIDGGNIRLPRLIGHSRATDMILTGREVAAVEAEHMGLVNRITEPGNALAQALRLAQELAELPQVCLRSDRFAAIEQWSMSLGEALSMEADVGLATIGTGETQAGAARFVAGAGRHGTNEASQ